MGSCSLVRIGQIGQMGRMGIGRGQSRAIKHGQESALGAVRKDWCARSHAGRDLRDHPRHRANRRSIQVTSVAPAVHPLAARIHDRVLQLVGLAMVKADMAEQLGRLGRQDEVPAALAELRSALDQTVVELRAIMVDLKNQAN